MLAILQLFSPGLRDGFTAKCPLRYEYYSIFQGICQR